MADPVVEAAIDGLYGRPARVPVSTSRQVVLHIDRNTAGAEIDDRFLSVAIDTSQILGGRWWSRGARRVEIGRGDDHRTPFDLSRPRLRALAAALAPAYLRVGGTEADFVYYDMKGDGSPPAPAPYELVLSRDRWDAVNDFARTAGYELLFTVNAGPGPRTPDGRWSPENLGGLLDYTRREGYRVPVWELGNEVSAYWFTHGISHAVSGRQYAEDLTVFARRVREAFPAAKIAGPATLYWPIIGDPAPFSSNFLRDVLDAGSTSADIVTWHFYPQQSRRCPAATRRASAARLLDPAALDEMTRWGDGVRRLANEHAPNAEVWLGETGNAQCGGEPGVSDRFVGSLWWMDELGLAASHGQRVVVRQTLAGSDYGLIDNETLAPNPDYWASLLWKRLMGRIVLDVKSTDDDPFVRTYAHCTPAGDGSISLLVINLHPDRTMQVRIDDLSTTAAQVYLVTSPSLTSSDAYLNDRRLRYTGYLPTLEPRRDIVAQGRLDLPAASYAFVVLPSAGATACGPSSTVRSLGTAL
jgi:heparanase 1